MNLLHYTDGLISLPWWGYVVLALITTHLTIICVTLFLHRYQTHRGIKIHPLLAHPMRFWLWLTTGMVTKEWVAIHRKHHHKVETEDDPHSPRYYGLSKVLWDGIDLYRVEATNKETLRVYGKGTPCDWIEKHLYAKHNYVGIVLLLPLYFALFGFIGISLWAVQMLWIPFFAAGVINGAAHAVGYRNFETPDDSNNLTNLGIIIGGEELHNNHHAFPGSAKFSNKPWEFDIGWGYIRILELFRLIKVRNVAPTSIGASANKRSAEGHNSLNLDTVKILLNNNLHVMAEYIHTVMKPIFCDELKKAKLKQKGFYKLLKAEKYAFLGKQHNNEQERQVKLAEILHLNHSLQTAYEYKNRLQALWQEHKNDHEKLKDALLDWCYRAEQTGINSLQEFALRIKCMQIAS